MISSLFLELKICMWDGCARVCFHSHFPYLFLSLSHTQHTLSQTHTVMVGHITMRIYKSLYGFMVVTFFYDVTYLPVALKWHAIRYLIALPLSLTGCAVTHNWGWSQTGQTCCQTAKRTKKACKCLGPAGKVDKTEVWKCEKILIQLAARCCIEVSHTLLPFVNGHTMDRTA